MKRSLVYLFLALVLTIIVLDNIKSNTYFLVGVALLSLLIMMFRKFKINYLLAVIGIIIGTICLSSASYKHTSFIDEYGNRQVYMDVKLLTNPSEDKALAKLTQKPHNKIIIRGDLNKLKQGDVIKIFGTVYPPAKNKNYKTINYQDILYSGDVYATISIIDMQKLEYKNTAIDIVYQIRTGLLNQFDKHFSGDVRAIMKSMILGERSEESEYLKTIMRNSGIYHAMSISGMHIAIIMMFLLFIMKRTPLTFVNRNIVTILILFIYVALTGFSVACVRSFIMASAFLVAQIINRPKDIFNFLIASAVFIIVLNPYSIYDISFLLSFCATAGMIIFTKDFENILFGTPSLIRDSISTSIAAQISTLPLSVYLFGYLPYFAAITNVLVIPYITVLTILGIFATFLLYIPLIDILVSKMITVITIIIIYVSDAMAKLPILVATKIDLFDTIMLYVIIIVAYVMLKKNTFKVKFVAICVFICMLCINFGLLTVKTQNTYIDFLNLGNSDCSLIRSFGQYNIMIDGGDDYNIKELKEYLNRHKIKTIDAFFASHLDSDHIGILKENNLSIKTVYLSSALLKSDDREKLIEIDKKYNVKYINQGDIIEFGHIKIDIISAISDPQATQNNCSLVLKVSTMGKEILYTADIDNTAEKMLKLSKVDVLKVAHHGSKYSSCEEFLNATRPTYSVISVGENSYGMPDFDVLERVSMYSNKVYRTDRNGTVRFVINQKGEMEAQPLYE